VNLALDFGEPKPAKTLTVAKNPLAPTDSSLERVVETFEAMQDQPNSPITAIRRQPAREAELVEVPDNVDARLTATLKQRGVSKLYSHQREAFDQIADGKNIVVVTPTASGKSLCYNLPVLNSLLNDPDACALYLFPTKALSEDQLASFHGMVESIGSDIRAFTYDGDTPGDARRAIRRRANVVLTNPDMLHAGVLPHHTKWARFFEKLQYIVVDELHTYRGVFGSHLANIFRRLRRICNFYGSDPQFICSSATIANPKELAEALTQKSFVQVDRNGAPSGEKYFVFYNPPVVNRQLGIRRSYINEARRMAQVFLDRGLQTLVFTNSRLSTEILVRYLKNHYERSTDRAERIRGYRGGYLPRERREIERQLREGETLGVVSTSALELGVDIGSLDACVMAGYPGSIASTWQRAGRAGRRQSTSVTVMVASSAPIDQYIVERPDYFFEAPAERACINADNLEILVDHLKCAVFELPFHDGEQYGTHDTAELLNFLKDVGVVHHSGDAWHWTSESYPADAIALRSISSDNFVVVDISNEANVIGEVAFTAALTTLHEKAIYLHEGRQYHVEKFDYAERKAYVKSVKCDYYTDAIDYTQVKILESFDDRTLSPLIANHGEVRLNRRIIGFKKLKFYTNENVGAGNLQMPEQEIHTTAFWLHFPSSYLESFADYSPTERQNGVVGLGNVLRTVGSLLLMCDPRDLGVTVTGDTPDERGLFEPDLFLYDNYPGGIGQSEPLYRVREQLLDKARALIEACPCEAGCPGCGGPPGEAGDKAKVMVLALASGKVVESADDSKAIVQEAG
jgi:DEAD/DEAH box helicase domain-containing protein